MAEASNPELSLHPPELYDLGCWFASHRSDTSTNGFVSSRHHRIMVEMRIARVVCGCE